MDNWLVEDNSNSKLEGKWTQKFIYLKRAMRKYSCHLFVIELRDEKALDDYYTDITEQIAAYFQTGLTVNIEIWNIYLVFVINSTVNRDIKYRIEQDKYSSRKIVLDNVSECSIELIQDYLDKQIFKIDTMKFRGLTDETINVSASIKDEDPKLFEVLKKFRIGQHMEAIHEKYLNGFENE